MLICERCDQEIEPGSEVDMIGLEPDARIVDGNELVIVHRECPPPEFYQATQ
jgi:hypothetical protein